MDPALKSAASAALSDVFGFEAYRPGQEAVIAAALEDRHVLAVMPTGAGKSLCYQIPAIVAPGATIVVSPLIALMKDQVDDLVRLGVAAAYINSSLDASGQAERIAGAAQGKYKLLYVAPERFRSRAFLEALAEMEVSRMVVDEAHCISHWGHDFRPDYLRLRRAIEAAGDPPVFACTATATPRVQNDIIEQLGLEDVSRFVTGFARPNLRFEVRTESSDAAKQRWLREFLAVEAGVGIVYCGTRKKVEEIDAFLRGEGVLSGGYHAGMDDEVRSRVQDAFMNSELRVIVATNAFGMGIDKEDVRFVVHYQIPRSLEAYYQEAGRAGRDGLPARCALLYVAGDSRLGEFFIDQAYPTPEQCGGLWDVLKKMPNPVLKTHKDLKEAAGVEIGEMQVGACLRMLEDAGAVENLRSERHTARVLTDEGGEKLAARVKGKNQKAVWDALAAAFDMDEPGEIEFVPAEAARGSGLEEETFRRTLAEMRRAGFWQYYPPFAGRGVLVIAPDLDFDKIPIDWAARRQRESFEREKLDDMLRYTEGPGCRAAAIVDYFGGKADGDCGHCDHCAAGTAAAEAARQGFAPEEMEPARNLLACADEVNRGRDFGLGRVKLAQVATGAGAGFIAQLGLDRLGSYGSVDLTLDAAKDLLGRLISGGLLRQTGGTRPTVIVTEAGRKALDFKAPLPAAGGKAQGAAPGDAIGPALAARQPALSASRPARPAPGAMAPAAIDEIILRCVSELPFSLGKNKIAQTLAGSGARFVRERRLDLLSTYGKLTDLADTVLHIDSLIAAGLLRSTGGTRPVIEITATGAGRVEGAGGSVPGAVGHNSEPPKVGKPAQDTVKPALAGKPAISGKAAHLAMPCPPSPHDALVKNIEALLSGNKALALVAEANLRYFREDRLLAECAALFEQTPDQARRAQLADAAERLAPSLPGAKALRQRALQTGNSVPIPDA
jgi:ATP-dependent DNA helicase RecQ